MRDSSALGAKTARACDSCLIKRARWFCAADDAFLCHACDNLVHSANQLASRHERVRLQTASSSKVTTTTQEQAWHSGFTRKARTPRHHNNNKHFLLQQRPKDEVQEVLFNNKNVLPLVPELGGEELVIDDEIEEDVLCRVPVFDPFDSELYSMYNNELKDEGLDLEDTNKVMLKNDGEACDLDKFSEFLPSDVDLAEFAADVESLLDEDSGEAKGPEMMIDCKEEDGMMDAFVGGKSGAMVKVKDEELDDDDDVACHLESILDVASETFDWNMELESMAVGTNEEEEEKVVVVASGGSDSSKVGSNEKERFLRLNYEEVIAAWSTQGSPWTTGNPHKFNSYDCWPDYLLGVGGDVQCTYGEARSLMGHPIIGSVDGGREARVSRYREKRRTRLFAKKIRYEVRKLNAEKRPRMKGRFVKRTSIVGANAVLSAFPVQLPLTSK